MRGASGAIDDNRWKVNVTEPFDYEKSAQAVKQMSEAIADRGGKLTGLAIPWFTAATWSRLLEVAADRSNLPDTFEQFERDASRRFDELVARGHPCERILIDVERLIEWCRSYRLALDARARAVFAAAVMMERDSKAGSA